VFVFPFFCWSRVPVRPSESFPPTSWPGPRGCLAPSPMTRTTRGLRIFWTRPSLHRWSTDPCLCYLIPPPPPFLSCALAFISRSFMFGVDFIIIFYIKKSWPMQIPWSKSWCARFPHCTLCVCATEQAPPSCLNGTVGIKIFHNVMTKRTAMMHLSEMFLSFPFVFKSPVKKKEHSHIKHPCKCFNNA